MLNNNDNIPQSDPTYFNYDSTVIKLFIIEVYRFNSELFLKQKIGNMKEANYRMF